MNDMARKPATPAEELRSIARTGDALPQWCRDALGQSVQLRIPIRDVVDLRRTATILRVLASRMEVLSQDRRDSASVLFDFWSSARAAQAQLQSRPKRGP